MLYSLFIENIALIDKLQIEFDNGLNVLTGESGAGKSIIVNSMNLILGERADKEMIKTGCKSARVEALFYLNENLAKTILDPFEIEYENELIVSRILSETGKNICKINGYTVNLNTLKEIMSKIVDLHGQHFHHTLLKPENHVFLLDSFADSSIADIKRKILKYYQLLCDLKKEQAKYGGNDEERVKNIELLTYQVEELQNAAIEIGEVEKLINERDILLHAEDIAFALKKSYELLYGAEDFPSIVKNIIICEDIVSDIAEFSPKYQTYAERLNEHAFILEDIAHEIHGEIESITINDARREEIEERLFFLRSLFRKYEVNDEEALINILSKNNVKLEELNNSFTLLTKLNVKIQETKSKLLDLYNILTDIRKKAAEYLKNIMVLELTELGMPQARFEVRFTEPDTDNIQFGINGIDKIEFFVSTNVGEILKPLAKTASGGELSRIMLAFKKLYAKDDTVSTFIFDEIDTGISGKMALKVAEKMAAISVNKQVICVSHLPQIAAMADQNYLISKTENNGKTLTNITQIYEDDLISEIARLSGGIKSKNAYEHANELRTKAKKYKEKLKQ